MADQIHFPADGRPPHPRDNGELAFSAPWQSRIFGVTAALVEAGTISWSDMQAALIHHIGNSQTDGAVNETYWTCWLTAVGQLLRDAGAVDVEALQAEQHRLAELYAH